MASAPRGGIRVLLVEDDVDGADMLALLLQAHGHEVEVAYDGEQGVARAKAFRPDVVLCDLGLPRMDGFAVARAIRSDPELSHVRLVAQTGYAAPEDVELAHEAGFELHLRKPLDLDALIELFASSLNSDRS